MPPTHEVANDVRKRIIQAYNNPETGLDNIASFAKRERIPLSDVREVLKGEEPYTLNVYTREKFPRRKIILNKIDEVWSADLMDVQRDANQNNGVRYLLIVVDGLSKFVWVEPLKNKEASNVEAAFKHITQTSKRKPQYLWTDEGTEFLNSKVRHWAETNHIQIYHTQSKVGSVFAERFIRTLRLRLARLADIKGTHQYIDELPKIIALYNNTPHSTTKIAPSKVAPTDEDSIRDRMAKAQPPNQKPSYPVGTHVRMADERGIFSKEGTTQRWSRQIYKIRSIQGTRPITYQLETFDGKPVVGSLYDEELQSVHEPTTYAYEVLDRRKKGRVNQVRIHWLGYSKEHDQWVDEKKLESGLAAP
jgi:ribosome biogenesis protein Nip4